MDEKLFPGMRDSLIKDAEASIKSYELGIRNQRERLAKLNGEEALKIKIRVRIGTYWGEFEKGTKTEVDSESAETIGDAITQAIRAAIIEFCCVNNFREDPMSMYLDDIDIVVEDLIISAERFIGRITCLSIFGRLCRDESVFAEVRERKSKSK